MKFLIYYFLIFIFLEIGRWLRNRLNNKEIGRKTSHLLIGLLFSFSYLIFGYNEILFLFFSIFLITNILLIFKKVRKEFFIDRKTIGVYLFSLGFLVNAFFWLPNHPKIFLIGGLILTFSDTLSAIVGKKYGKKKIVFDKTYIGSFAFFISSYIILNIFFSDNFIDNIIIASVLTIIEIILIRGFDNLIIPVLTGVLIYFLI